jgi:hypothetical protein
MSKPTQREPSQTTQDTVHDGHAAGLTRRTVLAGAAAATAVVTIGADTPAVAQGAIPEPDMTAFKRLSAALTGIPEGRLAPATDSIEIKQDYFKWVSAKEPAAFASLLQIAKDNLNAPQAMIDKLQARDDTKFLARSIVLMWYLGSWYSPGDLKKLVDFRSSKPPFIPHTVISPKAYTQGWLWRIAQAHPMGYSDMQFGYWSREPAPIEDFIGARTTAKGGT